MKTPPLPRSEHLSCQTFSNGLRVYALCLPFSIPAAPDIHLDRFVYAYIIESIDGAVLVDTGVQASFAAISRAFDAVQGGIGALYRIVLTHAHPDHIGSAALIAAQHEVEICAQTEEVAWIEDVAVQKRERPVPGFDTLVAGSVKVGRMLSDGDNIPVGGSQMQVLHTPGHSPGSVSLYLPSEGILFSGDAVFVPGDLPIYTDAAVAMRSLQRLSVLPRLECLYSAWDIPRFGKDARSAVDKGIETLKRIHAIVREEDARLSHPPTEALCAACIQRLGLPPFAANPLTARSFESHRRVVDRELDNV